MSVRELFAKHDDEFLQFVRVVDPAHPCRDICACLLLHELYPTLRVIYHAEPGKIYFAADIEDIAAATEEQVITLVRCGVYIVEDTGYLAMLV